MIYLSCPDICEEDDFKSRSRGHPEDEVVKAHVGCQLRIDLGLKAPFQVPDIPFVDYHVRPQREI